MEQTKLRFTNQGDSIEIGLAGQESDDLPSKGDAYVTIRVSSAGYSGHNDLWVDGPTLRSFCAGLINLEKNRRGHVELESISPEELQLKIRVVDSRGHVAVEGNTGYSVQRENSTHWHSVQFGFEFDPSQLIAAVAVDWVQRNAALDS